MKFKIIVIGLTFLSFFSNAQSSDVTNHKLEQVIEGFRTSIIEHNNFEKFSNLFLHDSITWASIFTNKSKEMVAKKMPDFVFTSSDYKTFYNNLADGSEEKFYNIKMDVRDQFATISFDYTLAVNSTIQNWGTEYWSLMLVNNSWKITSVTWSMNIEKVEKCPFVSEHYFKLQ
ncbi:hypothetical protein [Aquimarina algiphila]|uniref:hypothetical protein n=1 Tax=Aquimarina algiphila TaxID=2047982 RepID=UPI00232B3774|nr:hypothetical protein [Aquimarina algiphila]